MKKWHIVVSLLGVGLLAVACTVKLGATDLDLAAEVAKPSSWSYSTPSPVEAPEPEPTLD